MRTMRSNQFVKLPGRALPPIKPEKQRQTYVLNALDDAERLSRRMRQAIVSYKQPVDENMIDELLIQLRRIQQRLIDNVALVERSPTRARARSQT